MTDINFGNIEALTFDCYGTLIDWERGIINALQPLLEAHHVRADEEHVMQSFARQETALEASDYIPYREVLAQSVLSLGADFGFVASDVEARRFAGSVADWPAFPDSASSLSQLAGRFHLGVITNCDDDLFALSNQRLGVTFDWIVTAQKARSYKPSLNNFHVALELIARPKDRILHVAQSLHHDHVPAKQIGLTTVWINRRHHKPGFGATPAATASPDLTVPDMQTFAGLALAGLSGSAR